MEQIKKSGIFLVMILCLTLTAWAQDDREDVIYLKNGNIYRGVIVEQVPGETMKIEIYGGNIFTVSISDIAKITKERKQIIENTQPAPEPPMYPYHHEMFRHHHSCDRGMGMDTMRAPRAFQFHKKGYLFMAQLVGGVEHGGIRIINGYKFSRFAQFGIGLGIDNISNTGSVRYNAPYSNYNNYNGNYNGVYLPIFLYYGGDILRKRITPFYSIEAGYAFKPSDNFNRGIMTSNSGPDGNDQKGGLIGAVNLGVKFYTRRKVFLSLALSLDYKHVSSSNYQYYYDASGNYIQDSYVTKADMLLPAFKLGIGF